MALLSELIFKSNLWPLMSLDLQTSGLVRVSFSREGV